MIDGLPDHGRRDLQQYRKRARARRAPRARSRCRARACVDTGRLDFAIERDYDAEAQVMGMAMEGVDIAVLYPTDRALASSRATTSTRSSRSRSARPTTTGSTSSASYSPEQLKFVAMLPVHDVHLACRELVRCVRELGAVGSFIRPNLVNGHYWHSNYWDPLYSVHEELNVTWGFHEGTGAWYSHMNELYGENRFYRHVASHWIEMQQALIAMIIGGVFEFHPKLRVGFLEAPELVGARAALPHRVGLSRSTATPTRPTSRLTPKEYFRRNCWAAVEGSEPEIEATAGLIGADRMCVSTDYPHFDSNFPNVSSNLLKNCSRETAAQILMGGAHLYGFTEADFQKADKAAAADKNVGDRRAA